MADSLAQRITRSRFSQLMMRPAVTLLELLCAIVIFGLLVGGGNVLRDSWLRARRANQVAELLRWEVTVARNYAIRSGRPMTMIIDEPARTVTLHDGTVVRRMISLGDAARLRVDRLALEIPGDSLVFSARGVCENCPPSAPAALSVEAEGRAATVQVEFFGKPQIIAERAGGT
jgi:prepilin-type N-terminal cleavage/methylation domain-containing protein